MKLMGIINRLHEFTISKPNEKAFNKFIDSMDTSDLQRLRTFGKSLVDMVDTEIEKRSNKESEKELHN